MHNDAQLLQDLFKNKPRNLKKEKRLNIPARVLAITAQYPMLKDMPPYMVEDFLPAVCACMEEKYTEALGHFINYGANVKINEADLETFLLFAINLSAAAGNQEHYIHFSKVRIEYLANKGRNEEARAELNSFLEILPNDEGLLAIQKKLDGVTEAREGENLYTETAWLFDTVKEALENENSDIGFYRGYANKCNGEILDIGCGGGRVSIALAQDGHTLTAMDLSEQMLARFRHKLGKRPELAGRISIVHGNAADFSFSRKFGLIIMPNRVFQLLTEEKDAKACLQCVYNHLADDGTFIINAYNVTKSREATFGVDTPLRQTCAVTLPETGDHVVLKERAEKTDIFNRLTRFEGVYEVTRPNGKTETYTEYYTMKYYYEPQLRALAEQAGFVIKEHFGFYDKKPRQEPPEIIYVCKKAR